MQSRISPSHRDSAPKQHNPAAFRPEFFELHRQLLLTLVRSAVRRNRYADRDDLFQIACIALWQAADRFDALKGYPFPHYASVCIANALKRTANVDKAQALFALEFDDLHESVSTDVAETCENQLPVGADRFFGDAGAGEPYQRCLLNEIAAHVATLKPHLQDVYHQHLLSGIPQSVLASDMGVSQQRVAKLKSELCANLMELLIEVN